MSIRCHLPKPAVCLRTAGLLILVMTIAVTSGAVTSATFIAAVAAASPASQAPARVETVKLSQPRGDLVRDFENRIVETLLGRLEDEFSRLPALSLNTTFFGTDARRHLNVINYYARQTRSLDTNLLSERNRLRLQLLDYTRLMLQQQVRFADQRASLSPYHGPHVDLLRLLAYYPATDNNPAAPLQKYVSELAQINQRNIDQAVSLAPGLTPRECTRTLLTLDMLTRTSTLQQTLAWGLARRGSLNEPVQNEIETLIDAELTPQLQLFASRVQCPPAAQAADAAGDDFYRYQLQRYSASDLLPEALHELGLAELARLQTLLEGQPGGQQRRPVSMDADATARQGLLDNMHTLVDANQRLLANWTGLTGLPDLEIVLEAPALAPFSLPQAYYPGHSDIARLVLNADGPVPIDQRELSALSRFLAIPGQHVIASQPAGLTGFMASPTQPAFMQGWALYLANLSTEEQAPDPGLLRLNARLAAMLVIDTGIHYFDWSRERAIAYLNESAGLTQTAAARFVDEARFRPASMTAAWQGMLAIKAWMAATPAGQSPRRWQTLLALGPLPAPIIRTLSVEQIAELTGS